MANQMEEVLDRIARCETAEELERALSAVTAHLGYNGYSYIDTRRLPISDEPVPFNITTVPTEYVEAYIKESFMGYDPVVRRAATSNAPFTWADCQEFLDVGKPRRGVKTKARRVMEFAHDFGYTQGYVIPCHGVDSHGRAASALLSLFWSNDPGDLSNGENTPAWLRLAAATFHERLLELRGVSSQALAPPSLTDRERECLVWACRGKTRNETADILNIAERTVEFHFDNAMKKLGVYNKFHAIAVAIHLGLISP